MKSLVCLCLSVLPLLTSPVLADSKVHILTAEQWNVPRDAVVVLAMPVLQAVMQEFQSNADNRLLIKYPGGDEGTLWSSELRGWLISMGVASTQIEVSPGTEKTNQLEIQVIQPK